MCADLPYFGNTLVELGEITKISAPIDSECGA
jgi:hypothetical protein